MWLRSERPQRVRVGALDLTVEFAAGEEMLTEVSCKFRPDGVSAELADAGLRRIRWWTDSRRRLRAVVGRQVSDSDSLADRWRAARPPVAGLHLDSAACSRQSFAVIDAAAQHARHEAEVGGYVAAEAAAPVLDAGRAAFAALTRHARRRGGVHHRLAERAGSAAGQLAGRAPDAGLPARRVRPQPGRDGRPRIRACSCCRPSTTAGWRSTTRRSQLEGRPAGFGPSDRRWPATAVWCNRLRWSRNSAASWGCRWSSTPPRRWARWTARWAPTSRIRRRASGSPGRAGWAFWRCAPS